MIPYIEQPSVDLGPITIYAFGVLLAAAFLVGIAIFKRRAARAGLDLDLAGRLTAWVVISGLLGAHLVDRLFYNFGETLESPLSLLLVWQGISSYGGLLGGIFGAWLFFRRNPQEARSWRHLDAAAYAVPFAFILGRLGCFLAYDHVGTPTDFFLGQTYADGVVRHNMGLEEALYWMFIAGVMVVLGRSTARPPGFLVGVLAVLYAPGRFLLDFLRVADERHLGLIVSQYASIVLFAFGLWVLWRSLRQRKQAGHEKSAPAAGERLGSRWPARAENHLSQP